MTQIEFTLNNNTIKILGSQNEIMEDICKRFATKANANINNLIFLYSGSAINLRMALFQIMNYQDKQRNVVSILVDEINNTSNSNMNSSMIKSNFPICPKCSENIIFDINNYNIILSECKNGHSINLLINEYEKSQNIDLRKILCNKCKKSKFDIYNYEMYICNQCKIILCPLCKQQHEKSHSIISYDEKNYRCSKHNELYISYCNDCLINLCFKCLKEHLQHNILSMSSILPEKNDLYTILKKLRKSMDIFNKDINQIIEKMNKVKQNFEKLYKIYYDMVDKYDDGKRNYEIIMSLNNINNNNIMNDLENINQTNNINNLDFQINEK